jgi:recombinational DNA repair ATPase RecF
MYGVTLTRFGLHNYRNIACADLDLSRGAVGLIGCNASGKTNIARGAAFFFEDLRKKTCLGA